MKLITKIDNLGNIFTGYYISKVINSRQEILLHRVSDINQEFVESAEILVYSLIDESVKKIGTTVAVNWQQGSLLQWLDDDTIVYNNFKDGQLVTTFYSVQTGVYIDRPYSFSTIAPNKSIVASVNHSVLASIRESYSYPLLLPEMQKTDNMPWIKLLNIDDGHVVAKITPSDCQKLLDLTNEKSQLEYLEHPHFNDKGSLLYFIYRRKNSAGDLSSYLFLYDTDNLKLKLLNDTQRITHCNWSTDNTIVSWGGIKNPVDSRINKSSPWYRAAKKLYKMLPLGNSVSGNTYVSRKLTGDQYCLTTINQNGSIMKNPIAPALMRDGHPSIINDILVTDCYPDKYGHYELIQYNLGSQTVVDKVLLTQDINFIGTGKRCDLHPKFDGNFIIVDRLESGKRFSEVYEL